MIHESFKSARVEQDNSGRLPRHRACKLGLKSAPGLASARIVGSHFGGLLNRSSALLGVLALMCGLLVEGTAHAQSKTAKELQKLQRNAAKEMRKGQYEKSIRLYAEILRTNPENIEANLGASLVCLKAQDYVCSFSHSSGVLSAQPDNARALALAGMALLRSGHVGAAIQQLNRSLTLDPKEGMAWGAVAEIDYYEGRINEAYRKAMYAFSLEPAEPDHLITIARSASRSELFAEAAAAYERFLMLAPRNDRDRRERIQGLIQFYREISGYKLHETSGPDSIEVPFRLGSDRRPYLRVKINGRDANFVIDTGSGFTVISSAAARRLGITRIASGGTSQGVGGTGKFPIVYGLIRNINLGDVRIRSVPCFIRPFFGSEDRPVEERADGFIGLSILSRFLTQLDYKESKIILDRNLEGSEQIGALPDTTVIPFRTTQNGLISIESELDGSHKVNVIVDSGASSTVISTAAVKRLNLSDNIIRGQTVRVIGAAGISDNVELLFLRQCRVADIIQDNMRALVLDFEAINETSGFEQSGILGGDFLRHFRLTIDFAGGKLAFQPHATAVQRH